LSPETCSAGSLRPVIRFSRAAAKTLYAIGWPSRELNSISANDLRRAMPLGGPVAIVGSQKGGEGQRKQKPRSGGEAAKAVWKV